MCGILGYYSFGKALPDKQKLAMMFSELQIRGADASGFAYVKDRCLNVVKAPVPSSELVKQEDWRKLILPKVLILHARAKTQGSEKNNKNNHPIHNKQIAIVHNGIIYNDKEIFGLNQKRDAEVDSEAILALLEKPGKADKLKRIFDLLEGSFAFAAIDKNYPDTLILVKKDNPLELYYDESDDILYFCSEADIIRNAMNINKILKRGFNLGEGNFHHYDMENNHALIINKDGVDTYKKYYPKTSYRSYDFFDDGYPVECPHCLGNTLFRTGRLTNRCQNCGMEIMEEEIF
ncbi:MAG TPA: hypothetical protein VFF33_14020 [Ignavibacteriaceae bacterium]|nr:hypothetical protein [Ignavibacteriaceae bacterium]